MNEKVFRQMDKVGVKVNATAEKFGLEPFWPTNMTQGAPALGHYRSCVLRPLLTGCLAEIEKCARILRAFTGERLPRSSLICPQHFLSGCLEAVGNVFSIEYLTLTYSAFHYHMLF